MIQQSHSWGIYSDKITIQEDVHPDVHRNTITASKTWKQPKCFSTDECIKKMWNNGILLSPKKE